MPKYIFVFRKSIIKLIKKQVLVCIYLTLFSYYKQPIFCRYVLQRRQGHDSGFHSIIAILKPSIDFLFFKLFGRSSYIFGPKT